MICQICNEVTYVGNICIYGKDVDLTVDVSYNLLQVLQVENKRGGGADNLITCNQKWVWAVPTVAFFSYPQ